MIRRILVAVEFSEASERALDWAVAFARSLGASIEVFHVLDLGAEPVDLATRQQAARRLEGFLARRRLPPHTAAVIELGPPVERIVQRAEAGDFHLVVLGGHARSGLAGFMSGVAERVARRARRPVIAVPHGAPEGFARVAVEAVGAR